MDYYDKRLQQNIDLKALFRFEIRKHPRLQNLYKNTDYTPISI